MSAFKVVSNFSPAGDQPKAIESLTKGLNTGVKSQVLLGVTGSGKTYTMAQVIANVNRPTLVLAHNKTLAAQLCSEFRSFFPENAVEYFISYYDYYQPEAYVAQRDLYIEKEAQVNEEIERLRHRATHALLTRRDVVIVASVSCIYGLGTPDNYLKGVVDIKTGDCYNRRHLLFSLERIQYERNDIELKNGRYRVKGDVIDIYPSWETFLYRLEFFGDECERILEIDAVSGDVLHERTSIQIFPATHYVVLKGMKEAIVEIKKELKNRLSQLHQEGRLVEADRLQKRTRYDIEMMTEMGYCKGIENYSRHLSGATAGEAPGVLLDFFPDDFMVMVDESHVSIPQVKGMFKGDRARKDSLVEYGFRLPSALDNRPLNFEEFESKINQCIYVSATPGPYELELCQLQKDIQTGAIQEDAIVEQIIRPTGLLDPQLFVRPTKYQMDDLMSEIHERIKKQERVLVTTVTKKMSEDLAEFLSNKGIKVRYLHSDIATLERIDILHDLRVGTFDVLVGVNLLREGLDLPEVSLVGILDADKEGFLRNERSLIQTIGRAARNQNGTVILYADKETESMKKAIAETQRRRDIQIAYNKKYGLIPKSVRKDVQDILGKDRETSHRKELESTLKKTEDVSPEVLPALLKSLTRQMTEAADRLEFEVAAVLRDQIEKLKQSD